MAKKTQTEAPKNVGDKGKEGDKRSVPKVRWDHSKIESTYANVCNVSSTREEVTLLFGINQVWSTGQQELTVELTNRVMLNPFAAKRMSALLNNVIREYEARFGELRV